MVDESDYLSITTPAVRMVVVAPDIVGDEEEHHYATRTLPVVAVVLLKCGGIDVVLYDDQGGHLTLLRDFRNESFAGLKAYLMATPWPESEDEDRLRGVRKRIVREFDGNPGEPIHVR